MVQDEMKIRHLIARFAELLRPRKIAAGNLHCVKRRCSQGMRSHSKDIPRICGAYYHFMRKR